MAVSVNKIRVNSLYRAHRAVIFAIARLSCFSPCPPPGDFIMKYASIQSSSRLQNIAVNKFYLIKEIHSFEENPGSLT